MDFWNVGGLSVSFIIIASLLLWLLVERGWPRKIMKTLLIAAVLWYALLVYYTPSKLMGWPTPRGLPECGVVLSWKVIRPEINSKEAGIYLWIVPKEDEMSKEEFFRYYLMHPKRVFSIELEDTPRAYKIPYSRKEADKIGNAELKKRKLKGIIYFKKRKKGASDLTGKDSKGSQEEDKSGYIIIDPQKVLIKEESRNED